MRLPRWHAAAQRLRTAGPPACGRAASAAGRPVASLAALHGQLAVGLLLVAIGVGPVAGQSAIFVCTDATGRNFSGDRIPPECANRTVRELRADGSLRRVIEAPVGADRKSASPADAAEAADRAREQARRDRLLLEMYSEPGDVETARQRALAEPRTRQARAHDRLRALQAERQQLAQEAEFYRSRPWPASLRRAHESVDERERGERDLLRSVEEEVRRINSRYDAERDRLAELLAGRAGGSPAPRRQDRESRP